MAGAITMVILVNVTATQGAADQSESPGIVFVAMIGCLIASWLTGLVAVVRKGERSWVVLIPTLILSAVVANEVLQGLLLLFGVGE